MSFNKKKRTRNFLKKLSSFGVNGKHFKGCWRTITGVFEKLFHKNRRGRPRKPYDELSDEDKDARRHECLICLFRSQRNIGSTDLNNLNNSSSQHTKKKIKNEEAPTTRVLSDPETSSDDLEDMDVIQPPAPTQPLASTLPQHPAPTQPRPQHPAPTLSQPRLGTGTAELPKDPWNDSHFDISGCVQTLHFSIDGVKKVTCYRSLGRYNTSIFSSDCAAMWAIIKSGQACLWCGLGKPDIVGYDFAKELPPQKEWIDSPAGKRITFDVLHAYGHIFNRYIEILYGILTPSKRKSLFDSIANDVETVEDDIRSVFRTILERDKSTAPNVPLSTKEAFLTFITSEKVLSAWSEKLDKSKKKTVEEEPVEEEHDMDREARLD